MDTKNEDWRSLTAYAAGLGIDPKKLLGQARRCNAVINLGGIPFINVPEFMREMESLAKKKSAENSSKVKAGLGTPISKTTSVGLLRGQISRLTKIIADLETRVRAIPEQLGSQTDPFIRMALAREFDDKTERLEKNRQTLLSAEGRFSALAAEADKAVARILKTDGGETEAT